MNEKQSNDEYENIISTLGCWFDIKNANIKNLLMVYRNRLN